ncbi:hypothetical protein LBMAG36_06430 [Chlorobiota bacterium]|nr:hypothetical protein LBMAG36_06430 [Chlorobiota bacterium]
MTIRFLLLLCIFFSIGCNQSDKQFSEAQAQQPIKPTIKKSIPKSKAKPIVQSLEGFDLPISIDTSIQEYASFIGGLSHSSDRLKLIKNNGFYTAHAKRINDVFKRVKTKRLSQMQMFSQMELASDKIGEGTLLYPFSGPDALHAVTLFPNYKQYVFIAFEPPGSFRKFSSVDTTGVPDYLLSVQRTIQEVTNLSYFITDRMRKYITQENIDGALPLIALFLAETDHTLIGYGKRYLHADGSINEIAKDTFSIPAQDIHDMYFKTGTSQTIQRLTYIYANLGNAAYASKIGFLKNTPLQSYLSSLQEFNTYVKSASYLMHNAGFSGIRDFVLKKTHSILQDDTGVPFEYFDQKQWDFVFYGRYSRPINIFAGRYSAKLDSAYVHQESIKKPLPFMMGYQLRRGDAQNIYKAIRKG